MPIPPSADTLRARWRACLRLTAWLLAIGAAVTFGVAFVARDLSGDVLGWPFSFWVAAQGAPIVYLVLVVVYARAMRRLDARHGVSEGD
jgi:putative solute:sodium symporter small subunit